MQMYKTFKKVMISGLTLAMVMGGTTAVFADDGKDRGHDRDNDSHANVQGKITITFNFHDLKGGDIDWATEDIIRLAAKGVFSGYGDGTFRPRNNVSRIEALAATVNMMGLRAQAESQQEMSAQLNFQDAERIEKQYPWAVGYVAVALENGLFFDNETMVQPEKPATRLWATMLLVKALKLEDEAKANIHQQLSFKDANKIPPELVGYVYTAQKHGLIYGDDKGNFNPNAPITRAEIAAILDRSDNQLPNHDADAIHGTVQTAVSGNVLTVQNNDGQTVPLAIDPNAFVFKNGVRISPSALTAGDQVTVRTYNNLVIFVEVTGHENTTPATDFTVDGTFNSMSLNAQGEISTISVTQSVYNGTQAGSQTAVYNVSPDVTIIGDSNQLVLNHAVELKGQNALVTSIEVK